MWLPTTKGTVWDLNGPRHRRAFFSQKHGFQAPRLLQRPKCTRRYHPQLRAAAKRDTEEMNFICFSLWPPSASTRTVCFARPRTFRLMLAFLSRRSGCPSCPAS